MKDHICKPEPVGAGASRVARGWAAALLLLLLAALSNAGGRAGEAAGARQPKVESGGEKAATSAGVEAKARPGQKPKAKPNPLFSDRDPEEKIPLGRMSIEDLMNVEVVTASKHTERYFETASATYVLTGEDLRRMGVTQIAEALRVVPGTNVSRIDSKTWAISVRGFQAYYANKLLVMMDGRSTYNPIFSGVFWEDQDTMIEDIARIEVVRGPGGTIWGANAVNGVINIISKEARETQGWLLTSGAGTEERLLGAVRYGGRIAEDAWFRVYAKGKRTDHSEFASGEEAHDRWTTGRGGFRIDWEFSEKDCLTFQGDVFNTKSSYSATVWSLSDPYSRWIEDQDDESSGGNLLARWTHAFSEESEASLQVYYDRTDRTFLGFGYEVDTFDLDFSHRFRLPLNQKVTYGLGYRVQRDEIDNTFSTRMADRQTTRDIFSAFIQDEIGLAPGVLTLTLGAKFEDNDYTHFGVQPSGRLLWTPSERHSAWASIAYALRTPSRVDDNLFYVQRVVEPQPVTVIVDLGFGPMEVETMSPPTMVGTTGDDDLNDEELTAYELGYRVRATERLLLDFALFYNNYNSLIYVDSSVTATRLLQEPVQHALLSLPFVDEMTGETYGFEATADWQPLEWLKVKGGYSFLRMQIHGLDRGDQAIEETNPRNQAFLRTHFDLPHNLELDLTGRYVDHLEKGEIPAYVEMDARLAWKPIERLELAVIGRNLMDKSHPEFQTEPEEQFRQVELERAVLFKVTWKF